MATIGSALRQATNDLKAADVPSPALDARLLLGFSLACDQASLIRDADQTIDEHALDVLARLIARRRLREPVSRIFGKREFHGRNFALAPAVLDPRPDSETLIAASLAALKTLENPAVRILDLGSGSGALLVTLLAELPDAVGVGVDIDPEALVVARVNAYAHGVGGRASFVAGDWAAALDGSYDLIVANPPYIRSHDLAGLAPEVRDHDPIRALDGGADGLEGHRAVAAAATRLLAPKTGALVAEIGADQRADVVTLFAAAGLATEPPAIQERDLSGRDRVVTARVARTRVSGERAWNGGMNRVVSACCRPSVKVVRSPGPSGGSGRHREAKPAELMTFHNLFSIAV